MLTKLLQRLEKCAQIEYKKSFFQSKPQASRFLKIFQTI